MDRNRKLAFLCQHGGLSQIFKLIASTSKKIFKILKNTNVAVRRQVKEENNSLLVPVHGLKMLRAQAPYYYIAGAEEPHDY